jgi:hypothetical protein
MMPLSVFTKRAPQHDVLGMPDAVAICAKDAIPGIATTQIIAVVWGKDVADALVPKVLEVLSNPATLTKPKKTKPAKKIADE